jgi:hypothetical protein
VRKVHDDTGVDLCALGEGQPPLIWTLERSIHRFVGVLWSIVREEAQRRGITREAFEARFDEQALTAAQKAFWESLADFFQSLRPADARLIRATVLEEDQPTLGPSSGNSPESQASIPPG